MPLSARRIAVVLTSPRYFAIRRAFLSRWPLEKLTAWASGVTPTMAARLELSNHSGGFVPRDGWRVHRPSRKAA